MKRIFIETPVFTELMTGFPGDEDDGRTQEHLLIDPAAGDVITGTAGYRTLRWKVSARKGGKSGRMRVIDYSRTAADQIIFLLAYDHRSVDDLTPGQKRQLAHLVRQLK